MNFFFSLVLLSSACFGISWEEYKEQTIAALPAFDGWCSPKKAIALMDFIHKNRPDLCVEIGTYGGQQHFLLHKPSPLKKGEGFFLSTPGTITRQ